MAKAPWMKFYTADWRSDPGLRMCSYAARGLWIDMLTLMQGSERYGHLLVAGVAPSAADLAQLLGGTEREVAGLLAQLEKRNVFSRDDKGVIYSRRMLRDAERAEKDRRYGQLGGNPSLRGSDNPKGGAGVNPPDNPPPNGHDNAQKPEARVQTQNHSSSTKSGNSAREPTPLMPARGDRPERWMHLAERPEVDNNGVRRPVVQGQYLDILADEVCEAAGLKPRWRGDWRVLIGWLQAGLDPYETILPTIRKIAARPTYRVPITLSYFDKPLLAEAA